MTFSKIKPATSISNYDFYWKTIETITNSKPTKSKNSVIFLLFTHFLFLDRILPQFFSNALYFTYHEEKSIRGNMLLQFKNEVEDALRRMKETTEKLRVNKLKSMILLGVPLENLKKEKRQYGLPRPREIAFSSYTYHNLMQKEYLPINSILFDRKQLLKYKFNLSFLQTVLWKRMTILCKNKLYSRPSQLAVFFSLHEMISKMEDVMNFLFVYELPCFEYFHKYFLSIFSEKNYKENQLFQRQIGLDLIKQIFDNEQILPITLKFDDCQYKLIGQAQVEGYQELIFKTIDA